MGYDDNKYIDSRRHTQIVLYKENRKMLLGAQKKTKEKKYIRRLILTYRDIVHICQDYSKLNKCCFLHLCIFKTEVRHQSQSKTRPDKRYVVDHYI